MKVQVGGEFELTAADLGRPLLFVAGGIGITPLMSMISYYVEKVCLSDKQNCIRSRRHNLALLYALDQAIRLQWPLTEASSGLISMTGTAQVPSLLKAGMQPSATLLYSAGLGEELAFRAELNDLQESSEGWRYLACMSAAHLWLLN